MDQGISSLEIPGYDLNLVNHGRGKGIATYYTDQFQAAGAINKDFYQISKITGAKFDVINVYCSQRLNSAEFLRDLGSLAAPMQAGFIIGDFNVDFLHEPKAALIRKILSHGFKQILSHPTHMEGGLLDHVYHKGLSWEPFANIDFPYYSDHGLISICKLDSNCS